MYKIIVKTMGIKRKEQKVKSHDLRLGYSFKIDEDDIKSRAKDLLATNMKTSNKAVIMAFKAYTNDEGEVVEKLPSYSWEIL